MKQAEFLRLQLALLTLQYGEHAVLESLAGLRGLGTEDLQDQLLDIAKIRRHKTSLAPTSNQNPGSRLESILKGHPEKAELINAIKEKYDKKTLLSELKDVRRFLDRHGQTTNTLKTRGDAFNRVAGVLAGLSILELEQMLKSEPSNDYSGLGVISDQILGRE